MTIRLSRFCRTFPTLPLNLPSITEPASETPCLSLINGESYHPLPRKMLTYDIRLGGYVVDLDRRRLEGAPSYTSRDMPDWSDRSYTSRIDRYWMPPV